MGHEQQSEQSSSRYGERYISIRDQGVLQKPRNRIRLIIGIASVLVIVLASVSGYFYYEQVYLPRKQAEAQAKILEGEGGLLIVERTTEKETEPPETEPPFEPHPVDSTLPENMIEFTEIEYNGTVMEHTFDYHKPETITFGQPEEYTQVKGVTTFRGNNFRNDPTYGLAEMTENKLEGIWNRDTGGLTYGDSTWTGSGWTGQPLIMNWPKEIRTQMNLYDWAKEKDELVEVVYACMDGYIYFLELSTGEPTREKMYTGFTCKGSGALDPRGYPILYVGAGYNSTQGTGRVFIIDLLDCSIMHTFGNDDPFALRQVSFFDSSPLIDAESDTLIYPGENGLLYLIKLNTKYDEKNGTISVNPDPVVKWRYKGLRSNAYSYWLGMEDSAAIYKGYLYISDNGGHMMCLDLNTLQLVWVQDILDDSNSSPVLSIEDDHPYLYTSTSFRLGWRSSTTATVPIWKMDAETGEIIWQTEYECYTEDGVSGGVQSTIAPGSNDLSAYIYVTVARTGQPYDGVLACISRKDGKVKWEHQSYYAWSSPVCVYNSDGSGNVIYCACNGNMYLINGETGEVLDTLSISEGAIEASPAVYENYAVVGTRQCKIWGVKLK